MDITFVIGFKDREPARVIRSLDSLQQQSQPDFQVILVDYGSTTENSRRIQELLEHYPFCKTIYTDTRGWVWNRGAALNIGAKQAETKYLFFTDIDIVYDVDFVAEATRQMREDVFLIPDTVRVPRRFKDWEQVPQGKYKHTFKSIKGWGIACYPKEIFEKIGGFDEQYAYWSNEDYEIAQRVRRCGIEGIRARQLYAYHQWHPRITKYIPYSILFHNAAHYYQTKAENTIIVNQNKEWGKIITNQDRPVFQFVDPEHNLLLRSESVVFRDAYDMDEIHFWAEEIGNRPETVWAVKRNRRNGRLTLLANKFLHRIDWKLDHSVTYLDDFGQGLIFATPGLFKDYYLECSNGTRQMYAVFMG
jgi:GT2 family glycosyltransferase